MSKIRFNYSVKGMMYGIKINRKNSLDVLKTRTTQVQARMTRLAADTVRRRIEDRSYHKKLVEGGGNVEGTKVFEETPKGIGNSPHTPHKSIKNPLTRIVDHALKVTVKSFARKGVQAVANIKEDRIDLVRFFYPPPPTARNPSPSQKVPRASFVWDRLNETCLPFVKNKNYEKLVAQWSRSTQRAVQREFYKEFKGDLRKVPRVDS